jgi:hypothetical protein
MKGAVGVVWLLCLLQAFAEQQQVFNIVDYGAVCPLSSFSFHIPFTFTKK